MVRVRFMSTEGTFKTEEEATLGTINDALEACRTRYAPRGFRAFKVQDNADVDTWRITATTPGGRGGRNVAFVDAWSEDDHY